MESIEIGGIVSKEHTAQKHEQSTEKCSKSAAHNSDSSNSNLGGTSCGSNHKMGSRRIFTPQFKLQVLESYRNDNDCKGNQRATARKYNIHRRQIQKWLQCESSLRSSVANINHNTVKHQFHNISVHQQHAQKTSLPGGAIMGPTHQQSQSESTLKSIMMPALSTGVSTSQTQAQGVFSAVSLAAVVAAAAGAMTVASSPSNGSSGQTEPAALPLRSSSLVGVSGNSTAALSPLLHHHHYGIPTYMHAPASVQMSVPILSHHISHSQHIHQQNQHQTYQYHNLAYTHALTHRSDKQQSPFLSSVSLPDISALSAVASAPAPTTSGRASEITLLSDAENLDAGESLRIDAKTGSGSVLKSNSLVQNCQHKSVYQYSREYRCVESPKAMHTSFYPFKEEVYPLVYPLGPMDLSLRHRRGNKLDLLHNTINIEINQNKSDIMSTTVVDLTHRKRKGQNSTYIADGNSQSEVTEKQPKLQDYINTRNKCKGDENSDEDEVEIEVGTEEKLPPSKPVKLFKPYLLDDEVDTDNSVTCSSRSTTAFVETCESTSPWVCNTRNLSPTHCYDSLTGPCQGTTFQYVLKDNFSHPNDGANFHSETKSAFTSIPAISPPFFRCPKGSPSSSGYESSSSTYSDSSLSSQADSCPFNRTYNINLQMFPIPNENLKKYPSKNVEKWLEQEA